MSGLLDRLGRLFLEPVDAAEAPGDEAAVRWLPPVPVAAPEARCGPAPLDRVGVVCAPADAVVAGGAVGMALLVGSGAACAVIITWTGEPPRAGAARPALPGARRVAGSLRGQGHQARATGRLVRLALPAGEADAVAAADAAAPAALPTVLVVAGPRGAAMETALASCDLLVVAVRPDGDAGLGDLAARELERLGVPVCTITLPDAAGSQALCREGLRLPAVLRTSLAPILGRPA